MNAFASSWASEQIDQASSVKAGDTRERICPTHGPFTSTVKALLAMRWWTGCPTCEREADDRRRLLREHERRQEAERKRRELVESLTLHAGIPRRFSDASFEKFRTTLPAQKTALAIAMKFADMLAAREGKGQSLLLIGRPGTGKTHLAAATASKVLPTAYPVKYITAAEIVRSVRATYDRRRNDDAPSETEVLEDLNDVGLLIIDELGTGALSEHGAAILFDVIDRRYRDLRSMILCSNLSVNALAEALGERLIDRLRECAITVAFDWRSSRGHRT